MEVSYQKINVITIIATCDREDFLVKRAINSVINQSYLPNCLIVVNDSCHELSNLVKGKIQRLLPVGIDFICLDNSRTKGASGAWNTGLIFAGEKYQDIENSYIAILDDDDEWKKNHIKVCVQYTPSYDMIISGLIRFRDGKCRVCNIPHSLDIKEFLIGNPGIQGSNLFLRLSTIYQAGLFDENLLSSTDRDLCIRLSEVTKNVISTEQNTVIHYADDTRLRLSTFGTTQKKESLSSFWDKYSTRMTIEEKEAFLDRANKLFGFSLPTRKFIPRISFLPAPSGILYPLIVGIISGSAEQIAPLLNDLENLKTQDYIENIEVIVMHNGDNESELKDLVESVKERGLSCLFISQQQQENDAELCSFGSKFVRGKEQLPIGKARSVLQQYLGAYVLGNDNAIVWILDDDMRLDDKVKEYLPWLPKFREEGIDVLLGSYEGGSPNPPSNAIRIQLLDLLNNLEWLEALDDEDLLPDRSYENQKLRSKYPDYYYDLSRKHFGHLESIFWITPSVENETVAEARKRMLKSINKILTGEPLFRSLISDLPSDPISEAKDSANRGGTTFVLNHDVLRKTPNVIIEINGKESRRSDMLWAIINRFYYNYKIKFVNFPVYHNRNVNLKIKLDLDKTIGELRGASIYAALSEYLPEVQQGNFQFTNDEINILSQKVFQYLEQRLLSYKLNFQRIDGLVLALKKYTHEDELSDFIQYIQEWFNQKKLDKLCHAARQMNFDELKMFFKTLPTQIEAYSSASIDVTFLKEQSHLIKV